MADAVQEKEIELLRSRGTIGRLRIAFELHEFARSRLTAHFRSRHPAWTSERVRAAVRERFLGTC